MTASNNGCSCNTLDFGIKENSASKSDHAIKTFGSFKKTNTFDSYRPQSFSYKSRKTTFETTPLMAPKIPFPSSLCGRQESDVLMVDANQSLSNNVLPPTTQTTMPPALPPPAAQNLAEFVWTNQVDTYCLPRNGIGFLFREMSVRFSLSHRRLVGPTAVTTCAQLLYCAVHTLPVVVLGYAKFCPPGLTRM